jgi:hypothetical protein
LESQLTLVCVTPAVGIKNNETGNMALESRQAAYVQRSLHPGFGWKETVGYRDVRGASTLIKAEERVISELLPVCGAAGGVAVAHGEAGRDSSPLLGKLDRLFVMLKRVILACA